MWYPTSAEHDGSIWSPKCKLLFLTLRHTKESDIWAQWWQIWQRTYRMPLGATGDGQVGAFKTCLDSSLCINKWFLDSYPDFLLSIISNFACWCPQNMGDCAWAWKWTKLRTASPWVLWHLEKNNNKKRHKNPKWTNKQAKKKKKKKSVFLRKWGLYNHVDFPSVWLPSCQISKISVSSEKFHWDQWLCKEELIDAFSETPGRRMQFSLLLGTNSQSLYTNGTKALPASQQSSLALGQAAG